MNHTETQPKSWAVMAFVYRIIRPLFVKDLDPNEDYVCLMCCKPVLTRDLYCSAKCSRECDEESEKVMRNLK